MDWTGGPVLLSSWPPGQHTRPPCPSSTPGVYPNSCPLSRWCHPLLSPSPPALNLSQHQGLFKRVSSSHQVAKISAFQMSRLFTSSGRSFSFNISPSNEHPGLISFKMDWLDPLTVQGTLKTLLLHDSSKASILQCPAFFIVQHSHPYMTTGKNLALTRWTCVGKVMSLLLNMLSRLVITLLPRSKCL